jgi:alanine-synthesizing transaminase
MDFSPVLDDYPFRLNPLYRMRDELVARGEAVTDLISGSITRQGPLFPQEQLREILVQSLSHTETYQPNPLGQSCARQAIAEYYRPTGLVLPPEQILITPGTSLSYLYCFKLLADGGDEILCPSPSYPLFDIIARLAGVRLTYYRLREAHEWDIDLDYLESRLTTRTRAIVLISPHNPTGMVASAGQLKGLAEIAGRHQLPIIADEVFSEFLFGEWVFPRPALSQAPLVFTLNGFSKMFALPGLKLGWIVVNGDPQLVRKAMWTLEMISDTFLPVNELVQFAAPGIFRAGRDFLPLYKSWVCQCRQTMLEVLSGREGLEFVPPRGGFYLTLRLLEDKQSEDEVVLGLLEKAKVLVHPGHFYDIPPNHLVITFVQEPGELKSALSRLCRQISG